MKMNSIITDLVQQSVAQTAIAGHVVRVGFIVAVLLICLLTAIVIFEAYADQKLSKWMHDFSFAVVPLLIILGVLIIIQLAQLLHIL